VLSYWQNSSQWLLHAPGGIIHEGTTNQWNKCLVGENCPYLLFVDKLKVHAVTFSFRSPSRRGEDWMMRLLVARERRVC